MERFKSPSQRMGRRMLSQGTLVARFFAREASFGVRELARSHAQSSG